VEAWGIDERIFVLESGDCALKQIKSGVADITLRHCLPKQRDNLLVLKKDKPK